MPRTIHRVSREAVAKATGQDWDGWFGFIDAHGGAELDHKGIVKLLGQRGGIDSGWWQQTVTVGYEHARGRRITGETADAGFQVGVQKAIPMARAQLWELLTGAAGRKLWRGATRAFSLEVGARYRTRRGVVGELRTVKPGERLRLTWQPRGEQHASTLQLTLSCPRNNSRRTTLRFHHEKLASAEQRERMRAHWAGVLEAIAARAAAG